MASKYYDGAARNDTVGPLRPRLLFKTITFSDGTKLALDEDDIVVFVGPEHRRKECRAA